MLLWNGQKWNRKYEFQISQLSEEAFYSPPEVYVYTTVEGDNSAVLCKMRLFRIPFNWSGPGIRDTGRSAWLYSVYRGMEVWKHAERRQISLQPRFAGAAAICLDALLTMLTCGHGA